MNAADVHAEEEEWSRKEWSTGPATPTMPVRHENTVAAAANQWSTIDLWMQPEPEPEPEPESLNLSGGKLGDDLVSSLANSLSTCPALVSIDLTSNMLTVIPAALLDLKRLEVLELHDNDIISLPLALVDLPVLKKLRHDGNMRLDTATRILEEKGVPGLKNYIRDLYNDP